MRETFLLLFVFGVSMLPAQQPAFEDMLAKVAAYEIGDDEKVIFEIGKLVGGGTAAPADAARIEQALVKSLDTATVAGKGLIARQLMLVGSAACVPALSKMLASAETADIARYALERIPGSEVNRALREALPKTSGKLKAGIATTLGARNDAGSVAALRGLLTDSDAAVSSAAAAALGQIADNASAEALGSARTKATGALRATLDDAYLACAERMAARGDKKAAFAAYKSLNAAAEPEPVRIAALRGLAISGGADAVPLLSGALKSGEPRIRAQAMRQLAATAGGLAVLTQAFPSLDAFAKIQVAAAVADHAGKAGVPLLLQAGKDGDQSVRAAALLGLGKTGDPSVIGVLAQAAANNAGVEQARSAPDLNSLRTGGFPNERQIGPSGGLTEAAAARESLARMRGADVDPALLNAIAAAEPRVKIELIAATAERGIRTATPVLLKATSDSDREVRRAALRALRGTAAPSDVPVLLELLSKSTAADRPEVARVVSSALRRTDTASVAPVMSAYQSAADADLRGSLLSVLAQVGKDESLPVIRAALGDSNPDLRRGAIRALSDWPTPKPMPDLLAVAKADSNPVFQALSLQGYVRLAGIPDARPAAETVKLLSEAMGLARRAEEKRSVLSLVQNLTGPEAIALAEAAMKDPDVAAEAKVAADRLRQRAAPRQRRPQQ